jgi:malonyl CoA-acyl carrier protein transacylase
MIFKNEKIAITGIGIIAPKAFNKDEFWNNIINKKNCITEVPKDRWDWHLYYDDDHKAKDKTYSKIGGFIENFKFDPIKYRIPPSSAVQISRLQQLTIEAVKMALDDAGYSPNKWDPKGVGVVIANAMGAMKKEFSDLRVYKFFNEYLFSETDAFMKMTDDEKKKFIEDYERRIDDNILEITEDTMPGELANITSGRIANVFDFNGPNLTVDAACASSLAALDYAVMALRSGKVDVMISGGADEMMSPAAYVKFCKIGALSPDGSFPFDERANGFVMAEAVGIYVLKRLSDAIRDGDRIYGVINSVGASSDGKGKGITAPNPKGQKIAIENAFKELDYTPGDVDYVECHGTATRAGDAAECEVLNNVFKPYLSGRKIMVTSAKSNIGHTKAAAGSISLIKAALSLYKKILPPSANFKIPNPNIDFSGIEVITEPLEWRTDRTRRVNVSSFGFGGTNFHVALEEYVEGKTKYGVNSAFENVSVENRNEEIKMNTVEIKEDPKAPFSLLQGETFTVTSKNISELSSKLDELGEKIKQLPDVYPQTLISVELNDKNQDDMGITLVSKSPRDFNEKLDFIKKNMNENIFDDVPLGFKLKGIYPFKKKHNYKGKVGFVFPGQGSQYVDMMRDLAMKYDVVMDTFKEADKILEKMIGTTLTDTLWSKPGETKEQLAERENAIKQTQMTQPAVMTADMAMFRLLMSFGVKPDMVIGHSLGEYAAATAAGIFDLENGLRAVTSRAKEMSNVKVKDPGKMASISWPYEKVEEQLKKVKGYVVAANKNCPIQTVIAGEKEAVDEAVNLFKALGVQTQDVAVSHAFHSEIIRPAIGPYREFLKKIPISSWNIPIISNVTADFFPKDKEAIYDLLVTQMVSPVEFINQLKKMYAEGVRIFIECGPKRVLSSLVKETLKDKDDIFILSTNHPKRGGIYDFNDAIANLITVNFKLNWSDKYIKPDSKFYNPYYFNWAIKTEDRRQKTEDSLPVNGVMAGGQDQHGEATWSQSGLPAEATSAQAGTEDRRQKSEEMRREATMDINEFVKNYGFNFNPISVSGIAAGVPGSDKELFRERGLDEILQGINMIEPIPEDWQQKQINKNIIRIIKSETGNHRIEAIDSIDGAIKLSARKGRFDLVKDFGVDPKIADSLNSTFRMAIAAGVLALKDAHIPLVHYYKKTTTGSWLPEKWALPDEIADETGVIFASAFAVLESIVKEVTDYFVNKYSSLSDDKLWDVYDSIVERIHSDEDKKEIRKWMKENLANFSSGKTGKYQFSQNFLLKVIPIADSQFAQFVGAKGPAIHLSAACSSTTQSVHVAESWIRSGKCKRVIIVAADDISNELLQEWLMPGFVASGTATTKARVEDAALPFDRRRHGLIVGSGAVAMVIEDETLVRDRGVVPLARILLTEAKNSAYHVTRLDTDHVSDIMNNFMSKIERIYNLSRKEIAPKTLFVSHETYTPARGGSASAEVKALKKTFGDDVSKVIVSNVKGFTGHTMGASLEDAIAIRALNTGVVPPIANYKEPDPELVGINLSKGGKYNLKYAIRFAAGFGSHMAMSFIENTYTAGEKRIIDEKRYNNWLRRISGYDTPELEVVNNALRIKDKGPVKTEVRGQRTEDGGQKSDDRSQMTEDRKQNLPAEAASAQAGAEESSNDTSTAVGSEPAANNSTGLNEKEVADKIVDMIASKTGYPKDMLDLDLDMEADLGIDTVKQAELFGMIRESFGIPKQESISLKDYPTIRHCVKFVMDSKTEVRGQRTEDRSQMTEDRKQNLPAEAASAQAGAEESSNDTSTAVGSEPAANNSTGLNEKEVADKIVDMIASKTGYPKDMLDLDLDMEADLGIDTVKQAELFGMIRESFGIPKQESISLKDYPTIRHCVKFVMDSKTEVRGQRTEDRSQMTEDRKQNLPAEAASAQAGAEESSNDTSTAVGSEPAANNSTGLNEKEVADKIVDMIASKTGYPKDMLDLDLDMEADLGIDTVKQAELFGMIRESFGIPKQESISLKDYPTIRHCVKFVMDSKTEVRGQRTEDRSQKSDDRSQRTEDRSQNSEDRKQKPEDTSSLAFSNSGVAVEEQLEIDVASIMNEIKNNNTRHIRYTTAIKEMPVREEIIKKLDPQRPALIIGEDIELIKMFRSEFSRLGVDSIVITSGDTKIRGSYIVDFNDINGVEDLIKELSLKKNIGGIVYLMGVVDKKLDNDIDPFKELKYYSMPLFLSAKYFHNSLSNPSKDFVTFITVVTMLDGGFGYLTKETYDPIYASMYGMGLCLRKEYEKSVVKVIDFNKGYDKQSLVKRTFYEIQYSDARCSVSYNLDGKRYTMVALPELVNKEKEKFTLRGKKLIITGGGRGLGALFAKIASNRWKSEIIILDIIRLDDNAIKFARMSDKELENYKMNVLMAELKKEHQKVTPVMLEKEFTQIKDSANLYKTIKEIEALGAKVHYYNCDLNNPAKFKEVMNEIKNKFGRVDGLVHFAGIERSKLVVDKAMEEFFLIFNTKATSAVNILKENIIEKNGLWVMISSVAGKFGNLGQSDYAAASDYISKLAINLANRGMRAFSINMTAIANVGMGIRPGVQTFLKSQGVEFLYPEEVMNALADEISYGDVPEVVYSASLGKLDLDKQLAYDEKFPNPASSPAVSDHSFHFIEKIEQNSKTEGFKAKKRLSVESDKYMADHSINGTPLLPGVMGLEIFAETVAAYTGNLPLKLKSVGFKLPVKLIKNKPVDLDISAVRDDKNIIRMKISSDFINPKGVKMGDTREHFFAEFDFSSVSFKSLELPKIKDKFKYKSDKETIYKTYFHGPSFQVLDGIISVDRNSVVGVFKKPMARLLGDKDFKYYFHPMIIEAMFQTSGWRDLYMDNKMTLPDSINEVSISDNNEDPEKLFTYSVFKGLNNYGKSVYDAWAFDENGRIYAEILDYVMIPVNVL